MKKIFLIFITLALGACSSPQQSELYENRTKWQNAGLSHYRYQLGWSCFCSFFENMPLVIEVQDGEMISMESFSGGALIANDRQYFEENGTIDQIFTKLEADLRQDPDYFEVRYDQTYGFPTYVSVDYSTKFGDDDFSLVITDFEVLP